MILKFDRPLLPVRLVSADLAMVRVAKQRDVVLAAPNLNISSKHYQRLVAKIEEARPDA